jgi:hypothetical protein
MSSLSWSYWISWYWLMLNRWSDSWYNHKACSWWYLHAATSDATRLVARISRHEGVWEYVT